jgi:uncharacterized protein YeaO (DUF488 family)
MGVAAALLEANGIRVFSTSRSRNSSPLSKRGNRQMIQCKRVYDPASGQDGYRVLVDRLWPRGVKTDLNYDEWCKDLAPSGDLRKAFHADVLDFAAFREAYLAELADKRDRTNA